MTAEKKIKTDDTVEWLISDAPVAYADAISFMEQRVDDIHAGRASEIVWLLEHPPLYTAGTSADDAELLDPDRFPIYRAGRGGRYTYHGPGQRVAYVMLDLAKRGNDVRGFVHNLEDWVIRALAQSAGKDGMVSGQMMDIAAETAGTPLTLDEITRLQARKTGCLIEWSATAGAVLAGADTGPLQAYASALGLAFQIADDILDVEGDASKVGKALRKDETAGKATFVSLLGLEPAKARAEELCDTACAALSSYGEEAAILKDAARFVIARDS